MVRRLSSRPYSQAFSTPSSDAKITSTTSSGEIRPSISLAAASLAKRTSAAPMAEASRIARRRGSWAAAESTTKRTLAPRVGTQLVIVVA